MTSELKSDDIAPLLCRHPDTRRTKRSIFAQGGAAPPATLVLHGFGVPLSLSFRQHPISIFPFAFGTAMRTLLSLTSVAILFVSTCNQVSAEFINVVAATASNTESGSALATVDGSGFTADPLGSDLGSHVANIGTHWLGGPGTGTSSTILHSIYYQFDSVQTLENILFWNYNDGALLNRGVKRMFIYTSTDPTAYNNESHPDWSGPVLADIDNIAQGPGDSSLYGENFDVTDTEALIVRFRTFQTHGNVSNIGFAEARFLTTSAVPEPSSLLMVAAASLISVRSRRRR